MTVDVYLTNPLSPWVVKTVGDFLRDNKIDLRYVCMRLMAQTANSGTVALYTHEFDKNWELFDASGKDMWSTFPDMLKRRFPTVAALVISYPVAPPPRKRRYPGRIIPSIPRAGSFQRTLLPLVKVSPLSPREFGFQLPPQAPAFVQAPHPERTVSSILLGTPLRVDHGRLPIYAVRKLDCITDLYLT
jgi:hypothetical protein